MNIIKSFGNYCYSDEMLDGTKLVGGFAVYAWNANIGLEYLTSFANESQAASYARSKQQTYERWMK